MSRHRISYENSRRRTSLKFGSGLSNLDNDPGVILRRVYESLTDSVVPPSIPVAVLIIAKYQYQIAFVADQEINLLAALTEIMCECEFK